MTASCRWNMLVGFTSRLDATALRSRLLEVQTQVMARNHARIDTRQCSQLDRYGDGVTTLHREKSSRPPADLAGDRPALSGREIGQVTSVPSGVACRDPILASRVGQGKRSRWRADTMQWTPQRPGRVQRERKNLLPVTPNYTPSRPVERGRSGSLLNWPPADSLRRTKCGSCTGSCRCWMLRTHRGFRNARWLLAGGLFCALTCPRLNRLSGWTRNPAPPRHSWRARQRCRAPHRFTAITLPAFAAWVGAQ